MIRTSRLVPLGILFALLSSHVASAAAPTCPTGTPIATFKLLTKPAGAGMWLPLSSLNVLTPGETLVYEPVGGAFARNKKAQVAVVLVADDVSSAPEVLPVRRASAHAEWRVPIRAAAVGVVLGPQGIDQKKLSAVLRDDPAAIDRLADYADQTSKVEALVQALSKYEQSSPGSGNLQSVLNGFSAQYGVTLPPLDRSRPADQQAAALLRAITPALAPDAAGARTSLVQQSGGLAASVASMFFGAPAGLAIGGAALVGNLHASLFPPTDFRSAFTQPSGTALAMCTGGGARDVRARLAYVWMVRLPDAEPPVASLAADAHMPRGGTSTVAVRCASMAQLKMLPRARDWRLVSGTTAIPVPVTVSVNDASDQVTVDLKQANAAPGEYHLAAMWDWTPLPIAGLVDVRPFADLSTAALSPASQDRLIAGAGTVSIELTGADFEFLDRLAIAPAGNPKALTPLAFTLPHGRSGGVQPDMQATIDLTSLRAGRYVLALTQLNGRRQDVSVAVHPPNPTLAPLPLEANVGETTERLHLRGTRLERIQTISGEGATWTLRPLPAGAHDVTERLADVQLDPAVHAGDRLAVKLAVADLHEPIEIADALAVLGPRPKIIGSKASVAGGSGIELREGELPAGLPVSFVVQTDAAGAHPTMRLACDRDEADGVTLVAGQKTAVATLDFIGETTLFLSIDPGSIGVAGCTVSATLTNDATGTSEPFALGRVIRLPHIDTFTIGSDTIGDGLYAGTLTGERLETIEKTGWNATSGVSVRGIATPIAGGAGKQTLAIAVPWPPPSPHAALYVWLRGEREGRLTTAKY